jgi:glycosyltransferase involved in cell wall biosynthesis
MFTKAERGQWRPGCAEMAASMHVASVIAGLAKSSGGPTYSVASLCEATARLGVRQSLFAFQSSLGEPEHLPDASLVQTILIKGFHSKRFRISWSKSFGSTLHQFCRQEQVDILHCHGLWGQANHAAATVARALGIPLVISTHGMLADWALRHKAWKKRIAWRLYQDRDLKSATVIRATAEHEVGAIREAGFRQPVAVIPNGIEIPPWKEPANGKQTRTVLFLGRIYPVKGLLNLVEAWRQVRPSGWSCIIAGPDESGHQAEVQAAIRTSGLSGIFSFSGSTEGEAKWSLYRTADVFVLPSFTENFGLVVAEALACGVPVITTKGTPWECLISSGCGWWVDVGARPLANALREATEATDTRRREMGTRGRQLVERQFSWPRLGDEMKALYEWILDVGLRPDCVVLT